MSTLGELFNSYGWVLFMFGGAIIALIGAFLEGVRDFFVRIVEGRREHQLRIEEIRAGRVLAESGERLTAGPCPHRPKNVKPVFSALGDHEAYLCTACDAQLPKSWAVQEEDL